MRGRKPTKLSLDPADIDRLHATAHSDCLPWYQVRRARIVLALAAGQHTCDVAAHLECGVATVWRTGERYRREGLDGLLADGREGQEARRAGRAIVEVNVGELVVVFRHDVGRFTHKRDQLAVAGHGRLGAGAVGRLAFGRQAHAEKALWLSRGRDRNGSALRVESGRAGRGNQRSWLCAKKRSPPLPISHTTHGPGFGNSRPRRSFLRTKPRMWPQSRACAFIRGFDTKLAQAPLMRP